MINLKKSNMRPPMGAENHPIRPRKSSIPDASPHLTAGPSGPTTFFLRSEEEMELSMAASANKQKNSTYGVQSLEDVLGSSALEEQAGGHGEDDVDKSSLKDVKRRPSKGAEESPRIESDENLLRSSTESNPTHTLSSTNASPSQPRISSRPSVSQPLTPLRLESPAPSSAVPGSPKSISMQSLRLSDEDSTLDDVASQAIISSGEEEDERETEESSKRDLEFVMPSIQMPTRRPFTATGKNMGRLKVLVAGEAGIGKTSLIRSIVQVSKDIVHVDPLASNVPELLAPTISQASRRKKRPNTYSTTKINEISASTKAYPSWWSDMGESRVLRRRSSLNDAILERNLCFIDTPGFHKNATLAEETDPIIEYMEAMLYRNMTVDSMNENDLLGLLSGSGGAHVDVVLYLFSQKNRSKDIEFCRRLSAITNVIPLVGKADTMSPSQIASTKSSILSSLEISSITPFLFGKSIDELQWKLADRLPQGRSTSPSTELQSTQTLACIPPFAVSTKTSLEDDSMDASLLMSPDYVQPLVSSDLAALISQVFNPDNISWLRHSAAKKFIQWRNRNRLASNSMLMHNIAYPRPGSTPYANNTSVTDPIHARTRSPTSAASSLLSSPSPSQVLVPHGSASFYSRPASSSASLLDDSLSATLQPSEYALARLRDHTQAEEHFEQIKLAKWAADLQRSLRNERERFEQLERTRRAQWLLERVGEEVRDGRIVPALPAASSSPRIEKKEWAVVRRGTGRRQSSWSMTGAHDPRDPLGLCDLSEDLMRRGIVMLQVVGGFGVVGAVAVTIVKTFGAGNEMMHWWEWFTGTSSTR